MSSIVKLWPDKDDGSPGHPSPIQKQLWFDNFPESDGTCQCPGCRQSFSLPSVSPHGHDLDVVCLLGSTGAGKTFAVVRRLVWLARKYPGCLLAVCSLNFSHIEKTVLKDWGEFFTHPITGEQWKHPWLIGGKPNQQRKYLKINAGKNKPVSEVHFVNLEQFTQLLGTQFDAVHMEEAQNLKLADPIELLVTRLRSKRIPRKQIILTGNPTEELGWLVDWFKLDQLNENHEGPIEPIGKACFCNRCHKCRSKIKKAGGQDEDAPLFVHGECPQCGYKKKGTCPGNQHFQRVIEVSIDDNQENLPEGYQGNIFSMLRKDSAERLGRGKYVKKVAGLCYPTMGRDNVIWDVRDAAQRVIEVKQVELDLNKDMIWHMDFNERPQCSGVSQEFVDRNGIVHINTIDEIIEWDCRASEVAEAFVEKYKKLNFKKRVLIYGDPNGWQGKRQAKENRANFYQIERVLRKAGFRPIVMTRSTVFNIKLRIASVNKMIRDGDLVRWHVNERCVYHRWSAEAVEWDNAGLKERETIDIRCRNKGKPGEKWHLTHPMAGIGYFIVQAHPETPHNIVHGPSPIIVSTGSGVVTEIDDRGILTTRRINSTDDEPDDDEDEDVFDIEEWKEEMLLRRHQPRERQSLADQLRGVGAFGLRRPF